MACGPGRTAPTSPTLGRGGLGSGIGRGRGWWKVLAGGHLAQPALGLAHVGLPGGWSEGGAPSALER